VVESALAEWSPERFRLHIQSALPEWPMDSRRMQRVITNLVGNALEASPQDAPVEIQIRQENEFLVLRVRDHGAGLKPGEHKRIFEPFYTSRVQGTGLGLAVARRIVEGHGGTIRADNHPDGGAEFTVRLPPA
jgi:signal transduction histidine kinase